jgi:outer membrane immunogenic protein
MKLIFRSATFASLLALGIAGANAADIVDVEYVAAPAAEKFNWTGFFVGVHGGISAGKFDHETRAHREDFVYDATPLYDNDLPPNFLGYSYDPNDYTRTGGVDFLTGFDADSTGGFGGAQIGANVQFDQVVLGVVADFSASSLEGDTNGHIDDNFNFSATTKVDWFGTLRGRVGLAFDNVLVYGTGGAAYGKVKSSYSANYDGNGNHNEYFNQPDVSRTVSGETSGTQWGWAVGGGLEYGITRNVTLSTEYLYVDLGRTNVSDASQNAGTDYYGTGDGSSGSIGGFNNYYLDGVDVKTTFHSVKAGLNYKF